MADELEHRAQLHGDVAFHDLAVIAVELHQQVGRADGVDDGQRVLLVAEQIARHVALVDGLEHDGDAAAGGLLGGPGHVGPVEIQARGGVGLRRNQAGHDVHAGVAQFAGVVQRLEHAGAEFFGAPGQRRGAAFALGPVARGGVEKGLRDARVVQALFDVARGEVVGEEIFDAFEAVARGGGDAVEKRQVLVEKAQVGGEFQAHGRLPKIDGVFSAEV